MTVTGHYTSPLGEILLAADERGLTGLWLEGQKSDRAGLPAAHEERRTPIRGGRALAGRLFSGQEPDFLPPLHPPGSEFQLAVGELLLQIPYGQTTTYGALARQLAARAAFHGCRRRRSAARSGITGSRL